MSIEFGEITSDFLTDFHNNVAVFGGATGLGKCLHGDTIVTMYDGTKKKARDIIVGDKLLGPDSKPRNVTSISSGKEEMYKVIQKGNDDYIVNESHILSLRSSNKNKRDGGLFRGKPYGSILNIPLKQYIKESKTFKHMVKGWKPEGVVRFTNTYQRFKYNIPPYLLGAWLGDGTSCRFEITTMDEEIATEFKSFVLSQDYYVREVEHSNMGKAKKYIGCVKEKPGANGLENKLHTLLRDLGVFNNKHIPECYLLGNAKARYELLAGLLDSDGSLSSQNHVGFEYVSKSRELIEGVRSLSLSLGLRVPKIQVKVISDTNYYRISIHGETYKIPNRLKRKQAKKNNPNKRCNVWGIDIKPLGVGDYYGFTIDGDHLFLLGDFTVTHNTFALGHKLLFAASIQRAHHGIRRTHFLIARPSAGDVRDSLVKDLEDEILVPIEEAGGTVKFVGQYPIRGEVRFKLPDETEVFCEITAMGLEDQASAKKKLKSKKYTCAFIPEMQTMWEQGIIDEIVQRINRFPTDKDGGIYWEVPLADGTCKVFSGGRLWGDMNFTDKRHWFYKYMVTDNILKENGDPTRKFYELPSVLLPVPDHESNFTYRGENVRFEGNPEARPYIQHAVVRDDSGRVIPGSEYQHWLNQVEQMVGDDAQIDENIMGRWGYRTEGKPVYPRFNMADHVSSVELYPNASEPVYVGVDGGFNNAFVFGQVGFGGKLNILDEINNVEQDSKSIGEALDQDVLPLLNARYFGAKLIFVLDPSMYYGEGAKGNSQYSEFRERGLTAVPAPTQNPKDRLKFSQWFIDTRGVLEISNICNEIADGLAGGYNYKLRRSGLFDEHPDKNSKYSHIGDAFQYLCCQVKRGFSSNKSSNSSVSGRRRSLHRW